MRLIVVVVLLALAGCSSGGRPVSAPAPARRATVAASPPVSASPPVAGSSPASTSPLAPDVHKVAFLIRGTVSRTAVTYTTPDGRKHRDVVAPPWSRTFTVSAGQSLDVSAHSTGGGALTCALKVDGELVKSATSSGDSATVDCGDSLGF
jgi:hypothetical protein